MDAGEAVVETEALKGPKLAWRRHAAGGKIGPGEDTRSEVFSVHHMLQILKGGGGDDTVTLEVLEKDSAILFAI